MRFKISQGAKRFVAVVGIDDVMKGWEQSFIRFKVPGDVVEMGEDPSVMAQSPVLENATLRKWYFDITLDERYREVVLVVEEGRDSVSSDHADWCDAGFITN